MINFIKNKIAENRTARELDRLTNKELADIGITRSEIRNIARQHVSTVFQNERLTHPINFGRVFSLGDTNVFCHWWNL